MKVKPGDFRWSSPKNHKKNLKPIIKFNNGNGAILCNQCNRIIKSNLSKKEFEGKTDLLFCEDCKSK